MASPTFADLLRESGVLPEAQLARVLWAHAQSAAPVWQVVLEQTLCTEDHLFEAVARAARLPRLNLRLARVERAATERVDPAWAEAQRIAPLWRDAARGTLAVAMVDPTDYASVDHLGRVTGLEITREVASPSEVAVLLEHQFHGRELNRTPAPWNREAERHEDADDLVEDEKSSGSYDSWNIPKETLRAAETAAALEAAGMHRATEPGLEGFWVGPARGGDPAPGDPDLEASVFDSVTAPAPELLAATAPPTPPRLPSQAPRAPVPPAARVPSQAPVAQAPHAKGPPPAAARAPAPPPAVAPQAPRPPMDLGFDLLDGLTPPPPAAPPPVPPPSLMVQPPPARPAQAAPPPPAPAPIPFKPEPLGPRRGEAPLDAESMAPPPRLGSGQVPAVAAPLPSGPEEDEIPLDLGLDEEPTPAPPPPWRSSNPSTTPVPRTPIPHHLPMAASLSPAVTPVDEEQEALRRLWPVFEANQDVARALKAVFELCVARGIITREEYLERLASAPD